MAAEHFIVYIEPRPLLRQLVYNSFTGISKNLLIYPANSFETAIGGMARFEGVQIFMVGGGSYWFINDTTTRLAACFPASRFIIADDEPKLGCTVIAAKNNISAYYSLSDSPNDARDSIRNLLDGNFSLTPQGERFLTMQGDRIVSHARFLTAPPHTFTPNEWACFRLVVSGGGTIEISKYLHISPRSAKNMKYQVKDKLGVKTFIEVFRIAQSWGLLDLS